MEISTEGLGWILVTEGEREAAVHYRDRGDGRLVGDVVIVRDAAGVTSDFLRALPIGQLGGLANSIGDQTLRCGDSKPVDRLLMQLLNTLMPDLHRNRATTGSTIYDSHGAPPGKLKLPKGTGRKPDEFYRAVADAYAWWASMSRKPAAELARQNKVPVTTVHRWVKEARVRGFLTPGSKGKAG